VDLPFDLFTTTEVAGTTCNLYEWTVLDPNTGLYVLATSANVPVVTTFSYPNLTTADLYSPKVL